MDSKHINFTKGLPMNTVFSTKRDSVTPTTFQTEWTHTEDGMQVNVRMNIGMRNSAPKTAELELHTLRTAVELLQGRLAVLEQELA